MQKIAIMQPYFFPYLGYFQLMSAVDKFVLYDDVTFIKQGWINRNNIRINNEKKLITLPLKKISSNKKIVDVELNKLEIKRWYIKFKKSLVQNYFNATRFAQSLELIDMILQKATTFCNIAEFNHYALERILIYLNLKTTLISSNKQYDNCTLNGQDRVIDICKKENANIYINSIGGKELYDKKVFQDNGIELYFLKPGLAEYKQGDSNNFIPALSIIDVMMHNSPEVIRNMVNEFELI